MDQDIKKHWVKALRSGEYEQGRKQLYRHDKYCCLGVLAHEVGGEIDGYWYNNARDGWPGRWYFHDGSGDGSSVASYTSLTRSLSKYVGLSQNEQLRLIRMNDRGKSFAEIADYIEENL